MKKKHYRLWVAPTLYFFCIVWNLYLLRVLWRFTSYAPVYGVALELKLYAVILLCCLFMSALGLRHYVKGFYTSEIGALIGLGLLNLFKLFPSFFSAWVFESDVFYTGQAIVLSGVIIRFIQVEDRINLRKKLLQRIRDEEK